MADQTLNLKILSGGQTGVDRAALDIALDLGIPCGGCCPRHRRAEDGRIPDRYPLTELDSDDYVARTQANVRRADAVLLIVPALSLTGGSKLTLETAAYHQRPCWLLRPTDRHLARERLHDWRKRHDIEELLVAGPRRSKWPDGYTLAYHLLREMLE